MVCSDEQFNLASVYICETKTLEMAVLLIGGEVMRERGSNLFSRQERLEP